MRFQKILAMTAMVALMTVTAAHASTPAPQNDLAVAAPNLTLGAYGGSIDRDGKFILSGKGALSLTGPWGIQVDGADATGSGDNRGGLAAHLFNRNPDKYLLGLTTMWARIGSRDVFRNGVEGELYVNQFSIHLGGGAQSTDGDGTGYINTKLSAYVNDNLVLSLRGGAFSNKRDGGGEIEWQPMPEQFPASLFLSGGDTNDSAGYVIAGVRYSFGTNGASLKDRDRRYDPDNAVEDFTTGESGAVGNDECHQQPEPNSPRGPHKQIEQPRPCGELPPI